jgi:hypothetical protein
MNFNRGHRPTGLITRVEDPCGWLAKPWAFSMDRPRFVFWRGYLGNDMQTIFHLPSCRASMANIEL